MTSPGVIREAIRAWAPILEVPFVDPTLLLGAIAEVESSFGEFDVPRFEPAYGPGGRYYTNEQKERYKQFGAMACCSWGCWQIMYPTACELGYTGAPIDLWKPDVAAPYVVGFIHYRAMKRGAASLRDIAATYNGGNPNADNDAVSKYIQKLDFAYAQVGARRGLKT